MSGKTIGLVFSKDRPLQLDATLRSLALHCADSESIEMHVLWKATDNMQLALYYEVRAAYPAVSFTRETGFAADVRRLVRDAEYVMFVVDDTLFVRDFTISDVTDALEADSAALAFSLRLGSNTTYCYPQDRPQPLPEFSSPRSGILAWHWPSAEMDFGYPLELSSSVYRMADVVGLITGLRYHNPNTMESAMAAVALRFQQSMPRLMSFEPSAAFCAPLNLVQTAWPNRVSTNPQYSAAALAQMFDRGQRIDVGAYSGMVSISCHQEVELHLIPGPDRPAVSVIIPCFEQGQYLSEAVESVVGQTFEDWEVVIVDDGSSDDTASVAEELIRRHPGHRIQLTRQENGGPSSARNTAAKASKGRYILPLDADDRIDPVLLDRTAAVLDERTDAAIAYTDVLRFGAGSGIGQAADFDRDLLPSANQLNYCSLYRRGVWLGAGGYNLNMVAGYEDWDFWIAAAEAGFRAVHIEEPLFHYRIRPGSRDALAQGHNRELRAIMRRNHPEAYTPWRRATRYTKRVRRAISRRVVAATRVPWTRLARKH
jgi:glycosyltransferase involved in cell wall biosynthesis